MKKEIKEKLAKVLIQRLEDDGFQYHFRLREEASDYGSINEEGFFVPNTDYIEEHWKNEKFINWLLDVGDREMSDEADEIRKLLGGKVNF